MALTKFTDDLNVIQKLDNEPNDVSGLSAEELKAKFDEASNLIQRFINETLIPDIERMAVPGAGDFKADGTVPLAGDVNANQHRIFNLGAPLAMGDAVPKSYLDDIVQQLQNTMTALGNSVGAVGNIKTLTVEKIVSSKQWTAPKATGQKFLVYAVGGGGGGGGGVSGLHGAGGGGGGYVVRAERTIAEGEVIEVTCGVGGTPGTADSVSSLTTAGGNGGVTKFGTLLEAAGGNGGGSSTAPYGGAGGAGGGGGYSTKGGNGGSGSTYGGGGGAGDAATGGNGGSYGGGGGGRTRGTSGELVSAYPALSGIDVLMDFRSAFALEGKTVSGRGGSGGYGGSGGRTSTLGGGGGGGFGGDGGNASGEGGGGGGGYGGKGGDGYAFADADGATGGGGGGLLCDGGDGRSSHGGGGGGILPGDSSGNGGGGGVYIVYFKEE